MGKYKICVYAICKNEENFVDRWVDSMKEADKIYVLDTGSTDKTVQKLKERNVHVICKKIDPWRFDVARNESLKLVDHDTDICVCTDLDEVFENGWRQKLEENWNDDISRARYNYNWSFDTYGNPAVNFYIEKIHKRFGYHWEHPVHEVLVNENDDEKFIILDNMTLNHYPDSQKSRSSYFPLLELSVKENPLDDRNMHYLGREYMYYGKWNEAIDTLIAHLHLKRAVWKDERCASMRFIARCYTKLKRYDEAEMWYQKAIVEAPYLREPFVEYGVMNYNLGQYQKAIDSLLKSLEIEKNPKSYINEPYCYDGTVEDILSVCLYYEGKKEDALHYAKLASEKKKNDSRIRENIDLMMEDLKK